MYWRKKNIFSVCQIYIFLVCLLACIIQLRVCICVLHTLSFSFLYVAKQIDESSILTRAIFTLIPLRPYYKIKHQNT
jgi:hypothetical protein